MLGRHRCRSNALLFTRDKNHDITNATVGKSLVGSSSFTAIQL